MPRARNYTNKNIKHGNIKHGNIKHSKKGQGFPSKNRRGTRRKSQTFDCWGRWLSPDWVPKNIGLRLLGSAGYKH